VDFNTNDKLAHFVEVAVFCWVISSSDAKNRMFGDARKVTGMILLP
jgi:hypothetical protein